MKSLWLLAALLASSAGGVAGVNSAGGDDGDNKWCARYLGCTSCVAYALPSRAKRSLGEDVLIRERCAWDPIASKCVAIGHDPSRSRRLMTSMPACREDTSNSSDPPDILPNWMGTLLNMTSEQESNNNTSNSSSSYVGFGNLTLLDISLPGTHDTLSYDLSLEISDDGLDTYNQLDRILHYFSGGTVQLLPGELEDFLRAQSQTQRLDIVAQLNGGIRFLDIRIMLEEEGQEWYGVHFMQTYLPALEYFKRVRTWLDAHPNEIVVIWLSKHGLPDATGNDQYPGASIESKAKFWRQYCRLFDGLLLDTTQSAINATSIGDLIQRNHRVITFATDYVEFTNSSPYALDGSLVKNWVHGEGAFDEAETLELQRGYFQEAPSLNTWAKMEGRFTLMGMNTEGTESQILGALKDRFLTRTFVETELLGLLRSLIAHLSQLLGIFGEFSGLVGGIYLSTLLETCPSDVNIPGVTDWCPATLLEVAELSSYYDQVAIEEAFLASFISPNTAISDSHATAAFPHAFYLDGLDVGGTIRTGTSIEDGTSGDGSDDPCALTRYAYVDTIISYNTEFACRKKDGVAGHVYGVQDHGCYELRKLVAQRRQKYPLKRWEDPLHGRHTYWPSRGGTDQRYLEPI